jgi:hypothetical protein
MGWEKMTRDSGHGHLSFLRRKQASSQVKCFSAQVQFNVDKCRDGAGALCLRRVLFKFHLSLGDRVDKPLKGESILPTIVVGITLLPLVPFQMGRQS